MELDIKIKGIFLLANDFIRGNQFSNHIINDINTNVEISYEFTEDKKHIAVLFSYKIEIPSEGDSEIPQLSYSSVHFAELEIENYTDSEENKRHIDKFINVNVAAMIFPFIREHLATTTMKAGIAPIMIPVINFVKRYKEKNF